MKSSVFLLLLCAGLFAPIAIFADVAPDYFYSNAIGPMVENAIVMDRETVVFTLPEKDAPEGASSGKAHATFWMLNPTDHDVTTTSTFPLSYQYEGIASPRYALPQTITVHVDGALVNGTLRKSIFPIGDPKHFETAHGDGYVFPLSIAARQTAKVEVDFDFPYGDDTHSPDIVFKYVLATGAGWAGPIKSAVLTIAYPYDDADWHAFAQDGRHQELDGTRAGNTATFTMKDINPTEKSDVTFTVTPPELFKKVVDAKQAVKNRPSDPDAYGQLAKAYRDAGLDGPGYWNSALKAIELRYGSTDAPTSADAVVALGSLYTDGWYLFCEAGCHGFTDEASFRKLLAYAKSHPWTDADTPALQVLRSELESGGMIEMLTPADYEFLPKPTSTQAAPGAEPASDMIQTLPPEQSRSQFPYARAIAAISIAILALVLLAVALILDRLLKRTK